uniref:Anaphylatoxin-like domain-containing protein n=1 Tax=Eptatretus burgeri TaxID=7764 RepID=A0A8C4PY73_EPTBU
MGHRDDLRLVCVILLSFVNFPASTENKVEGCCGAGITWASETGRCSDLPLLEGAEEDQGCRISQEQCCQASLQEANCQSGLSAAQNGGTCTAMNLDTCGQDHFKRCCDCCTLGIDAQKRGHSCTTLPALGYPCSHVFHACCQSEVLPGDITHVKPELHHQETHRDVYKETGAPGVYSTEQPPKWEQTKWPSVVQQSYVTLVSTEEDELTEDTENSISEESAEDHNPLEPRGPREHYETSPLIGQDVREIQEDPLTTIETPISQEAQVLQQSHDSYDHQEPPDVSDSQEYPTYDHRPEAHQPDEAERNPRRQNVPHSYTSQTSQDPSANEEYESDDQIPLQLQEPFQDEDHRSGMSSDQHNTNQHLGSQWSQERSHHSFTETDTRYEAQVSQWPDEVETQTITQGHESEEEESLQSSVQGYQGEGEDCVEMCDNEEDDGYCICDPGYELLQDTCGDIDECLIGSHNCREEQRCVNTEGSFHCQSRDHECLPGFLRNIHGECQDVNECFAETHNCAMGERCVNTNGSFQCVRNDACEVGYHLGRDNKCQDIDECRDGTNQCPSGTQCHNTPGAFNCRARSQCAEGFDQYPNGGCVGMSQHNLSLSL